MPNLQTVSPKAKPPQPPTTAKIFMNGRSQAVRLPKDFRFDSDEVYISRDEATGNVILSTKPAKTNNWEAVFQAIAELQADDVAGFLDTPKDTRQPKDPFADWQE